MDGKLVEAYKQVWGDRWEEYWYGRRQMSMKILGADHGENKSVEKVVYTNEETIGCSGENNDHPLTYYRVPDDGFVVRGYCDIKFAKRK